MSINNLVQSDKSVKIRKFYKETNSKILIDVKWLLLGDNKSPYLSTDIRQVKINGIIVNGWQEQKEAIKILDPELYSLVNCGTCKTDGSGMHQAANMQYHFNLAREQLGKEIYTQEKHNEKLNILWQGIKDHNVFNVLFKARGASLHERLKEYQDKQGDFYKYKDFTKSYDHWVVQIGKNTTHYEIKSISKELKSYFEQLEQYRKLEKEYKYTTLKSNSDLWTSERLADYYNLDRLIVLEILCNKDSDQMIKSLSDNITNSNLNFLQEMTNKYQIPLVISK